MKLFFKQHLEVHKVVFGLYFSERYFFRHFAELLRRVCAGPQYVFEGISHKPGRHASHFHLGRYKIPDSLIGYVASQITDPRLPAGFQNPVYLQQSMDGFAEILERGRAYNKIERCILERHGGSISPADVNCNSRLL